MLGISRLLVGGEKSWFAQFGKSKPALGALVLLCLIVLSAVFAPLITPQNPNDVMQINPGDSRLPPGSVGMGGYIHLLGTDELGRDLYSAILFGLRISLIVGVGSGALALLVGTTVGLIAAYFGGRTDTVLMRIIDFQLSFPTILLALMLLAFLGEGIDKIILALVVSQWAFFARTARSSGTLERNKEYMDAARCSGLSHVSQMFRHLLPNIIPPVVVVATVLVASAITLEATLSFLGLGVPGNTPSLGRIISSGSQFIFSGDYWISVFPGIALLVTVASVNIVGERIRQMINPKLN